MTSHAIETTKLWGDDIQILRNLSAVESANIFFLAKGSGMSSYPMRGRLVKLCRLQTVNLDAETNKYSITDIGRRVLQTIDRNNFTPSSPGWNKTWGFLLDLMAQS